MSDADREKEHKFHQDARAAWQQQNLRWETENAFLNHQLLWEMREKGKAKCLTEAPTPGGPAIVIGSGSTLDGVVDRLKDWKGAIVCSTSHGTTLVHYGAFPTYMSCLDPRVAPDPEMDVPEGGWDKTCYLAHVSAPKAYFEAWFRQTNQPAYLLRILEPTVPWYTRHLIWAYPWVKVGMLPFIDSTSSEISLAARLGYDPIYCIGVDYGGPRFRQWVWKGGEWATTSASGVQPIQDVFIDIKGQRRPDVPFNVVLGAGGLQTDQSMLYSIRGMLISAFMKIMDHRKPVRIYQMSRPSNVTEFPFVSFDEVLEKQGAAPEWEPDFRNSVAEKIEVSLAKSDTYLIPLESGFGIDYRVYMMVQQNIIQALSELNIEMLTNKQDLLDKEKAMGMPARELIEKGLLTVEHGELLIHERTDLPQFDVQKMRGMDIERTADHLRKVYELSQKKAGG